MGIEIKIKDKKALKDFKDGNIRVLVATDIVARGMTL